MIANAAVAFTLAAAVMSVVGIVTVTRILANTDSPSKRDMLRMMQKDSDMALDLSSISHTKMSS